MYGNLIYLQSLQLDCLRWPFSSKQTLKSLDPRNALLLETAYANLVATKRKAKSLQGAKAENDSALALHRPNSLCLMTCEPPCKKCQCVKVCDHLELDDDFYFEYDYSALASETLRFFKKQGYD